MARVWGALGQLTPASTTLTDAYTVPASKHSVVSAIITNTTTAAQTVRLSQAVNGSTDHPKQYLLYDHALAANTSTTTPRFTLKAADVVRVYASAANIAFQINGVEEDNT